MRFITTPEQDYLLSVLKATKVMMKAQAFRLISKLNIGRNGQYVDRCLAQLGHIRKIAWYSDDLFTLPMLQRLPVDDDMLPAIDVMLDLTETKLEVISALTSPCKLSFLTKQKDNYGNYVVTVVHPGFETVAVESLLSLAPEGRTVVFIISNPAQIQKIKTALPHYYALIDAEGTGFRYFSGNN